MVKEKTLKGEKGDEEKDLKGEGEGRGGGYKRI